MKRQLLFLLTIVLLTGCKKEEIIPVINVTGVTVLPTSKTVIEGETFTITANVSPADADNKAVNWSSSDETVATVDNTGKVTALKAGSSTITATTEDGGKTATTSVTVEKKIISVTGITVDPTSKTITEGETFTITATVSPADADNKSVNWTSSAPAVASVDNTGKVTTHKPGNVTITATTSDGGKTATTSVTVEKKIISVIGITVDPTSKTITEGETFTIIATVSPADADNKSVNWTSSAPAVASVDNTGKVTALKPGSTTITATTVDGGKTATVSVTGEKKIISVTGITVDPKSKTIIEGETFTITATVSPADADNKTVNWTSSAPAVASVDNTGKVTAIKAGSTTIKATTADGGKTATVSVTVKKKDGNGGLSDYDGEKL